MKPGTEILTHQVKMSILFIYCQGQCTLINIPQYITVLVKTNFKTVFPNRMLNEPLIQQLKTQRLEQGKTNPNPIRINNTNNLSKYLRLMTTRRSDYFFNDVILRSRVNYCVIWR